MFSKKNSGLRFAGLVAFVVAMCGAASAETITLKVGYSAGGGYDAAGRLFARHFGKFLPGEPDIVVENLPGGGSLKLAKLMVSAEPGDGSVMAIVNPSLAIGTVLDPERAGFSADQMKWVGAMSNQSSFCYVGAESGLESTEQFLTEPVRVGATGKSSATYVMAALAKNLFNPEMEVIVGFAGGAEIDLAVDRGELHGRCGNSYSSLKGSGRWDTVHKMGQWALEVPEDAGEVPDFLKAIDNETDLKAARLVVGSLRISHPIFMPPDVSEETLSNYRAAFEAMVEDEAFKQDAEAMGYLLDPTGGADVAAIVSELIDVSPEVIARAQELVR